MGSLPVHCKIKNMSTMMNKVRDHESSFATLQTSLILYLFCGKVVKVFSWNLYSVIRIFCKTMNLKLQILLVSYGKNTIKADILKHCNGKTRFHTSASTFHLIFSYVSFSPFTYHKSSFLEESFFSPNIFVCNTFLHWCTCILPTIAELNYAFAVVLELTFCAHWVFI